MKKNKEKLHFVTRIEEMSDKELEKRIKYSMSVELKNKIRPIPYMGKIEETISYIYPELIARCPMTKIMDLYKVRILYVPNKHIAELKSLKLYLWNYDPIPISHEHLFARIWKDFITTIKPKWCEIVLTAAARGEMMTEIGYGKDFLKIKGDTKIGFQSKLP